MNEKTASTHIAILTTAWFFTSIVGFFYTWDLWLLASFLFISASFYIHKRMGDQIIKDVLKPKVLKPKELTLKEGLSIPILNEDTQTIIFALIVSVSKEGLELFFLKNNTIIMLPYNDLAIPEIANDLVGIKKKLDTMFTV